MVSHLPAEATLSAEQQLRAEFDQFTYAVSHELNAPLRHMKQMSRLLEQNLESKLADKDKRYMRLIHQSVERSEAMIERLLQFSRLNTEGGKWGPVDIDQLLEDAKHHLARTIEQSATKITAGNLPVVHGDSYQLMQLFVHLLDNAIKFRRPDIAPRIEITAKRAGTAWEFTCSDNGIGLEDSVKKLIFEPFKSLHRDEMYGGVGMGLTIAKKVVEHHGGAIYASPRQEAGLAIAFTLPDHPIKNESA